MVYARFGEFTFELYAVGLVLFVIRESQILCCRGRDRHLYDYARTMHRGDSSTWFIESGNYWGYMTSVALIQVPQDIDFWSNPIV